MTIQFYAYYRDRDYAGCKEMTWPAPPTLRDLGVQLCGKLGPKFRGEFFSQDGRSLGEKVIVMINGRRVDFLGGLDAPLKESDTVLIFPVVAGG